MSAFESVVADAPPMPEEQRIVLHGVEWKQFEQWLRMRGDDSSVRLAYRDGDLELMAPSYGHEAEKRDIERLLETWSDVTGVELSGCGSWTVKARAAGRGIEPDTCFLVGRREERAPDIAIEVIHTRPLLNKLDIYSALGVREVWCWTRARRFELFGLRRSGYVRLRRSKLLADLDLELLAKYVGTANPSRAVAAYRAELKRRRS
ncbi:MAG: Uma2 family endonuclease [Myxococcales bacterium]|nr:Uma2 family endonuclease [Myxococcales bacterium]